MNSSVYKISPGYLKPAEALNVISSRMKVELDDEARDRIVKCREYLDKKIETCSEPLYGITTGFGSLCNISINSEDLHTLQKNLVMSHACGMGETLAPDIVRLMLLLKAQSLSYGNSGVQLCTVQRLLDFLNNDILPVVYSQGSLGASGDLAPLANMC
ncbi:MAG: aromatic amino acid ammonia-lyase, partial [Muribaculaceae bacterium]|nr:aromatic amino acid ammonia-lyase [Muribaculaceae bacterium]